MEYKKIEEVSYNLHLIKTNKFKALLFKVILFEKQKKEDITIRNILIDNLMSSSLEYPTMRDVCIKKQDLYGASITMNNRRIGNHTYIEYTMSILNPKFTEETMLKDSIEFYSDLLYKPNVKNNSFDKELFEMSKENLKKEILMENERPSIYGFTKFKENIDNNAPFSYHQNGYLEDLESITPSSLYEYYNHVLENDVCDICVIGDFDFDEMEQLIKDNFKFKNTKRTDSYEIILSKNRNNKEIIEESSYNQSKLFIGYKLNDFNLEDKKYALILFNIIFGNSPESRLFKEVREEKSLAYSINSAFRRLDNFYYVCAGISYNNYNKALNTIKKCLSDIQKNGITDEELDKAKALYISTLNDAMESPSSIIETYFAELYFDNDSYKKQLEKIEAITKKDIIRVANLLKIDTIYLLKEGAK
jgi:predicted Zn-dependent peptidase